MSNFGFACILFSEKFKFLAFDIQMACGKIDYFSFMMSFATEILFLFQHSLLQDSAQSSIS